MGKTYYTYDEMRERFNAALGDTKQVVVCRALKMKPQHLSAMVRGAQLSSRVLHWLGFEKIELYRKVTRKK